MAVSEKEQQLKVNPSTVVGTVYSQIVGVTITDTEVTLEFVYILPRERSEGQVVARVSMPRNSAEGLARVITETIKVHDSKKS